MKLTLTEDLRVIDVESISQRCLGHFTPKDEQTYTFVRNRLCGLPVRLSEQEEIEVSYLQDELQNELEG